jgi:hypothetical protein
MIACPQKAPTGRNQLYCRIIFVKINDYALSGLEGEGDAFLSQGVATVLMIYGFQPYSTNDGVV